MSPSEQSDNPWQGVGRGKQKTRGSSQTPSEGRGLPNFQTPSQVVASGRIIPKVQTVLQAAPNGRVQPGIIHSKPASKKEDIPYEIKNAREWDAKRRFQAESSSESSQDDDSDSVEWPEVFGDNTHTMTDDRSRLASDQRPISNAQPLRQPPSHPKAHPHGKPPGLRRAHPRANFNFKRDNLARAAFRKRLEPSGRFMLPKDCPDIEPDQKRMYDLFDEIGVRLGSFIRPPQHVKDRELLLWGDARQVQNTKDELNRWLIKRLQSGFPRKSMAKNNFARETSVIGDQHHRLMKKMQKEAKILAFQ